MYVASNHFVWRLVPVSIASQIRQLLQDKQFELALQLAVSSFFTVKLLQISWSEKSFTNTYLTTYHVFSRTFFPVLELNWKLGLAHHEHCNHPYVFFEMYGGFQTINLLLFDAF